VHQTNAVQPGTDARPPAATPAWQVTWDRSQASPPTRPLSCQHGRGPVVPASHIGYDGGDLPTLLALVAAGLGAALLPASAGPFPDGVIAIPLRRPRLVHRSELLALRTATARQRLVIEALAARAWMH
jgi:DNA-binding transcriptional LysR family regulator